MKKVILILVIFCSLFAMSCGSSTKSTTVSISSASNGLIKDTKHNITYYLTNKIEDKLDVINRSSTDIFMIHTGHILKPDLSKEENIKILNSLKSKNYDIISLSLEDFVIADKQGIKLDEIDVNFLNSSVLNVNEDKVISAKNIVSYIVINQTAFIGLSDKKVSSKLDSSKFMVGEYVLDILKARKLINRNPELKVSSYIIIHTLGSEINSILERLPPDSIQSLTN